MAAGASIPIQQGWRLRVCTGSSIGNEYSLAPGRYVLGSQQPSDICVPDPSIAPQHVSLEVYADRVLLHDCSGGRGVLVNGKPVTSGPVAPGDTVTVGTFGFQLVNSSLPVPAGKGVVADWEKWLLRQPGYLRAGTISGSVALTLFALFAITRNPNLVPVTMLAMSAVVPVTLLWYLVPTYDKTGISLRTLAVTFLAGGTVGIIATVILGAVGGVLSGGLLMLPVFAGVWEEPAKLAATAWRWRHPAYDRPMDGLILGTVAGLGFAVFETAGYGFTALIEGGLEHVFYVLVLRGLLSPFGHGLWSGMVAAAFWQCGRDVRQAFRSRTFLMALAIAIGLHALWNAPLGGLGVCASGFLSVRLYRKLLQRKGFAK
jgi:RsiW-degrading membrane proteinase PrsW (M82 family)